MVNGKWLANGATFGTFTGPLASHNFTHYGTGSWSVLIDNMEYIGVDIIDNVVGDWGTFLSSNLADLEIVMGGWCPDYWHPINQLEPIFSTDAPANYNGLANATIDALMTEAHYLDGALLENKIDEIVNAVVVEQAAAMYWAQNRYAIGWNSNYLTYINDLFNTMGDKYFYNVELIYYDPPAEKEIHITAPISADSWKTDNDYSITWTSSGEIDNVNIELFRNGVYLRDIASNTINDASSIQILI